MDLGARTSLGVGGKAAYELAVTEPAALWPAWAWAHRAGRRLQVVGGGSNLLVADAGFDGLVVRLVDQRIVVGPRLPDGGRRLWAAAGAPWSDVVAVACAHRLWGIERLAGIPGQAGAAPVQNIGAYGQCIADVVEAVEVWTPAGRGVRPLSRADCAFAYRHSRFKAATHAQKAEVIVGLCLRLHGQKPDTAEHAQVPATAMAHDPAVVAESIIEVRRRKGMVWEQPAPPWGRSAGSFFVNPSLGADALAALGQRLACLPPAWPVVGGVSRISAAWLIEQAGFARGHRAGALGAVGICARHALALVNHGGARASQLVAFAKQVRCKVLSATGVNLRAEVRGLGLSVAQARALGLG